MRPVPNDCPPDTKGHRHRRRDGGRHTHPSWDRRTHRRLGPMEYVLLALIALGVAITIAMAIIDPAA
jgi:hypothetical protein